MEENKILEFVREFNTGLENTNEFNHLNLLDNGFIKGITVSEIYAWTDELREDHFKTKALGSLAKQLYDLQEVTNKMLVEEVDKFFAQKKKDLKEKFTNSKLNYSRLAYLRYKINISGKYNEDIMEEFVEVLREDFEYIFNGLTLDVEYD